MLAAGLLSVGLYQKFWYPVQRQHHEAAKVTGTHGRDPRLWLALIKLTAFFILPVIGFALGETVLHLFSG